MKRPPAKGSKDAKNGAALRRPHAELPPSTLRFLAASLKQQWKRYRKGLKRCQEKFSERAVHQSRVETRRLLAILELLGPFLAPGRLQKIQACLKEHLDTFDDLRDTQVQLASVGKMLRLFPSVKPFHEYLEKREERFTRQTRKAIRSIRTKRLGKLIPTCREDVKRWFDRPAAGKANALLIGSINKAFARTLALRNRIDPKDAATIHRTRVAFKRFRYMIESLADYFPRANEKLLEAMHRYQTMTGDIQDAEVLQQSVNRFIEKNEIDQSGARQLQRELRDRRQFLIRVYLNGADQLLDFWPKSTGMRERKPNGEIRSARRRQSVRPLALSRPNEHAK